MIVIEYEVILTGRAREDFENLRSLHKIQGSVSIEKIKTAIESLMLSPERHPFFEEEPWVSREIRLIEKDGACIFYYIDKEEKKVYVVRILYAQKVLVEQVKRVEKIQTA